MTDSSDVLLPLEGEAYRWAALSQNFYSLANKRPRGITFMIRAKNEQDKISAAISTIHDHLEDSPLQYNIVMIDNGSTDDTAGLAILKLRSEKDLYVSYPAQIAKAGLETYVTPCNSAHSFVWFSQFCLQKCTAYSHVFKWDADFCMEIHLAQFLISEFTKADGALPADRYEIHARNVGEETFGRESYLMSMRLKYRYYRHFLWECWAYGGVDFEPINQIVPHQVAHIVHDSALAVVKSYLTLPPWWETEPNETVKNAAFVAQIRSDYERWSVALGDNQKFCRSMDPACNPIMQTLPLTNSHIEGLRTN